MEAEPTVESKFLSFKMFRFARGQKPPHAGLGTALTPGNYVDFVAQAQGPNVHFNLSGSVLMRL